MYYLTGIWSYSRPYSVRIRKTRTRITSNTDTFCAVVNTVNPRLSGVAFIENAKSYLTWKSRFPFMKITKFTRWTENINVIVIFFILINPLIPGVLSAPTKYLPTYTQLLTHAHADVFAILSCLFLKNIRRHWKHVKHLKESIRCSRPFCNLQRESQESFEWKSFFCSVMYLCYLLSK